MQIYTKFLKKKNISGDKKLPNRPFPPFSCPLNTKMRGILHKQPMKLTQFNKAVKHYFCYFASENKILSKMVLVELWHALPYCPTPEHDEN